VPKRARDWKVSDDISTLPHMARMDETNDPARLTEFLAVDHVKLQLYLGAANFRAIGRRYAANYPQRDTNARWFSRNLPKFLGETIPYSRNPELAELASLETALNTAFEAPDVPLVSATEFASLAAKDLNQCAIVLHPSVQHLRFLWNATSLWAALHCGEQPPRPERLDAPQDLLVWRQGSHPRFRMLGQDEAMALDSALAGKPFSQMARALAQHGTPAGPATCAKTYLRGWVDAELVSALRNLKVAGEK
jgi:Putative DNA-binding domain